VPSPGTCCRQILGGGMTPLPPPLTPPMLWLINSLSVVSGMIYSNSGVSQEVRPSGPERKPQESSVKMRFVGDGPVLMRLGFKNSQFRPRHATRQPMPVILHSHWAWHQFLARLGSDRSSGAGPNRILVAGTSAGFWLGGQCPLAA